MGVGSGMGIGMTGSATGSTMAGVAGEKRFLPPMSGDFGLPPSDGGRIPPRTELRVVRPAPSTTEPTTEPETEPDTDAGNGTRAARFVYEPKLVLMFERGVGGTGYWT